MKTEFSLQLSAQPISELKAKGNALTFSGIIRHKSFSNLRCNFIVESNPRKRLEARQCVTGDE